MSECNVTATCYLVSHLDPDEYGDDQVWGVHVQLRNALTDPPLWSVGRGEGRPSRVWTRNGTAVWDEPRHHRYTRMPLEEALDVAKRVAAAIVVNGLTVEEMLARQAERKAEA